MSLGSEVGGGITRTSAIDWGGIVIEQLSRGDAGEPRSSAMVTSPAQVKKTA